MRLTKENNVAELCLRGAKQGPEDTALLVQAQGRTAVAQKRLRRKPCYSKARAARDFWLSSLMGGPFQLSFCAVIVVGSAASASDIFACE